jgi:peptide chain release factor 1
MEAVIEIRSGEGGDDAKLFVLDMLRMYEKYCIKEDICVELLDKDTSKAVLKVSKPESLRKNTSVVGLNAIEKLLKYEGGIHRVQRVPPTETKGRRHSSTITVAVLPLLEKSQSYNLSAVKIETMRGTGPGGQHRNTCDSGIRARHESGLEVVVTRGRSQFRNKEDALRILFSKLAEKEKDGQQKKTQKARKKQIGTAGRSEKIRTYNFCENRVKDVRVGKALYCLDKVMNGNLDLLYKKIK